VLKGAGIVIDQKGACRSMQSSINTKPRWDRAMAP
jgi:hypothetical protein